MAKVSKQTGNRRLLKLAALLEADAKNKKGIKFDITTVGRPSNLDKEFRSVEDVKLDCGTIACAMGLAAISGKFKKQGLDYKLPLDGWNDQIYTKWNGRRKGYDRIAVLLFGITHDQANYLFTPWTYPITKRIGSVGEREVIRRIKRVVKGKPIRDDYDNFL